MVSLTEYDGRGMPVKQVSGAHVIGTAGSGMVHQGPIASGSYLTTARRSFRWNRQLIVPLVEVGCRQDIVPRFARSVMLIEQGERRVRRRTTSRSGTSQVGW